MKSNHLIVKLIVVGVVSLLLLVPLLLLQGLVGERAQRREETETEIMSTWGGRQTLAGPVLTVPFISRSLDANGKRIESISAAHFLPRSLVVDGTLQPETRFRGMYQATVYTARLRLQGDFRPPDFDGIRSAGSSTAPVAPADVLWDQAYLSLELPDMRSLQDEVSLTWGSRPLALRSGRGSVGLFSGEIRTGSPLNVPGRTGSLPFSLGMSLRGGDTLGFLPLGEETRVHLRSPWTSPTFNGAFLPAARALGPDGFDADWRVISLARAFPQRWVDGEIEPASLQAAEFGVGLMTPVDTYQKVTRALKYGLLFLLLPFCTLFLFEVLARRRVHAVQYVLVGLADCVFYLLVLSLAEHVGFWGAYAAAAASCAALVTLYTLAAVRRRYALVMLPVLAGAYGFLAVVLSSEDFALLIGAVGLFVLLAAAMFLTRRVDWYRRDHAGPERQPPSPPTGSPGIVARAPR